MRKEGRAEWVSGGGKGGEGAGGEFWVWWRNVEEWAGLIAEWVSTDSSFAGKHRWKIFDANESGRLMKRRRKTRC